MSNSFVSIVFPYHEDKKTAFIIKVFPQEDDGLLLCPGCKQPLPLDEPLQREHACPAPPYELAVPWPIFCGLEQPWREDISYDHYPWFVRLYFEYPHTGNIFRVGVWEVEDGWKCPGCKGLFVELSHLKKHSKVCPSPPLWLIEPEPIGELTEIEEYRRVVAMSEMDVDAIRSILSRDHRRRARDSKPSTPIHYQAYPGPGVPDSSPSRTTFDGPQNPNSPLWIERSQPPTASPTPSPRPWYYGLKHPPVSQQTRISPSPTPPIPLLIPPVPPRKLRRRRRPVLDYRPTNEPPPSRSEKSKGKRKQQESPSLGGDTRQPPGKKNRPCPTVPPCPQPSFQSSSSSSLLHRQSPSYNSNLTPTESLPSQSSSDRHVAPSSLPNPANPNYRRGRP